MAGIAALSAFIPHHIDGNVDRVVLEVGDRGNAHAYRTVTNVLIRGEDLLVSRRRFTGLRGDREHHADVGIGVTVRQGIAGNADLVARVDLGDDFLCARLGRPVRGCLSKSRTCQ